MGSRVQRMQSACTLYSTEMMLSLHHYIMLPVTGGEVCFAQEASLGQVIGLVNGHHHCQGFAGPCVPASLSMLLYSGFWL